MSGYSLAEVPAPPESDDWLDFLQWSICVMDRDDPDLAFVASLLGQTVGRPGLTPKQAKWARRIVDRLIADFQRGALNRQLEFQTPSHDLADLQPVGHA